MIFFFIIIACIFEKRLFRRDFTLHRFGCKSISNKICASSFCFLSYSPHSRTPAKFSSFSRHIEVTEDVRAGRRGGNESERAGRAVKREQSVRRQKVGGKKKKKTERGQGVRTRDEGMKSHNGSKKEVQRQEKEEKEKRECNVCV